MIQFRTLSFVLPLLAALFSCVNDMQVINRLIDTETEPDYIGENVEIVFSDSARLQMKMIAPLVKQYNTSSEPRDEYPDGLHVWFYEKNGDLKGEVTANWAKYDQTTEIWEAQSDVVLKNAEGHKLETEQLFWDTQKAVIYSEKYTKYTRTDGTIATGTTFTATQSFSKWALKKGNATIVMNEDEDED